MKILKEAVGDALYQMIYNAIEKYVMPNIDEWNSQTPDDDVKITAEDPVGSFLNYIGAAQNYGGTEGVIGAIISVFNNFSGGENATNVTVDEWEDGGNLIIFNLADGDTVRLSLVTCHDRLYIDIVSGDGEDDYDIGADHYGYNESRRPIREAFDESIPDWIKGYMTKDVSRGRTKTPRAGTIQDFTASDAVWTDVTGMDVNTLRSYLKSGNDALFFKMPQKWSGGHSVISVTYDPNNKENGLKITGDNAREYKSTSFKKIAEQAEEVCYTSKNTNRKDIQNTRYANRKGLVSRKGDSAQDSRYYSDWDNARVRDASGYLYDTQKYVKKLAALHADDASYCADKVAIIFKSMIDTYTAKMQEMSSERRFDTYNKTGFTYIVREGERVITDAAEKINQMNEKIAHSLLDFDSFNDMRKVNHVNNRERRGYEADKEFEPYSEEQYSDWHKDMVDDIKRSYTSIQALSTKLQRIVAGKGESYTRQNHKLKKENGFDLGTDRFGTALNLEDLEGTLVSDLMSFYPGAIDVRRSDSGDFIPIESAMDCFVSKASEGHDGNLVIWVNMPGTQSDRFGNQLSEATNLSPQLKALKRAIAGIICDSWDEHRRIVYAVTERVINEGIYGNPDGPIENRSRRRNK